MPPCIVLGLIALRGVRRAAGGGMRVRAMGSAVRAVDVLLEMQPRVIALPLRFRVVAAARGAPHDSTCSRPCCPATMATHMVPETISDGNNSPLANGNVQHTVCRLLSSATGASARARSHLYLLACWMF